MAFWTFVLVAVAISTLATIVNNWIRAHHGYPLEDEHGVGRIRAELAALTAENRDLKGRLSGMEERLRVVERIATDPAGGIASAIDMLRLAEPNGSLSK
ncbi:MAG: hypothetical protein ABIW03_04125 [Sphingomicrobium sp.]